MLEKSPKGTFLGLTRFKPHPQPLPIPVGNREGSLNLAFFIGVPLSILKKWGGARGGVGVFGSSK